MSLCSIYPGFHWRKKYKNRPRNAKIKWHLFYPDTVSHLTSSLFHQTVNSSQRLSQSKVNWPHGDLVTLKARWPSHSELVTVVTRTVTTVLSADTEFTILRTLSLLWSLHERSNPRATKEQHRITTEKTKHMLWARGRVWVLLKDRVPQCRGTSEN